MKAAEGAVALTLIDLWRTSKGETLVIFESEGYAEIVADIVHSFSPECPVMVLPRWDVGPLDPVPPSARVMGRRMSVLHRIAAGEAKPLLLCAPEALMQKVPSKKAVLASAIHMETGGRIDPSCLGEDLEGRGYIPADVVDDPGEYALHGHALDIFPAGALQPLRIDFDDGEITGVHTFDPGGQRNLQDLDGIWIEAASEFAGKVGGSSQETGMAARASVFDYLQNPRIHVENGAEKRVDSFEKRVQEAIAYRVALGETPSSAGAFLSRDEWRGILADLKAEAFDHREIDWRPIPSFIQERNPKRALRAFVAEKRAAGLRIIFAGAQLSEARSLARAAGEHEARSAGSWDEIARHAAPALMTANLKSGFETSLGAVVIAAADLFGSRAARRTPMALDRADEDSEDIFRTDDHVVHQDHGRAIFRGLAPAPEGTAAGELLILEFAGGVRRLAPIGELDRIWKYSGPHADATLDKLGSGDWGEKRARIESELQEVAAALLARASARDRESAARLVPPADVYEAFAARFPFDLTGDQASAVETCLGDLASGRRMDRLLVGDVGFGKTEVALRTVAAAALAGKQACIIAPTTVLARQHEDQARRRFAGLGLNVGSLSRLVQPAQARATKKGLASGEIQVAVGTHALLSKTVRFRDLGLVVVDEEHRFGAGQKQKIRDLGANVHTLSMSATPIPRSLASAMAGLQDVSVLHTPPARRLPVRTIVADFDADLVRRALESEQRRRGQSFVVAPRIEDLPDLQKNLALLAPKLRMGVVHGRLPADELDDVMTNFAAGDLDVLLATNVIESGLDLPRANTIIVTRPERFGLAQLHQLRGRVGRGVPRGYAFLLSAPGQKLTPAARKRLDALAQNQRLGAGAAISELDLDIRGFGDLLGDKQSGRVKLVGPALYRSMLEDALESARTGRPPRSPAKIETQIDAYIPADYIQHPDGRVRVYLRISRARSQRELDEIEEELAERFGDPPEPVRALLGLAAVAQACMQEGVLRLLWGPKGVSLEFEDREDGGAEPHRILLDSRSISRPDELIDALYATAETR